MAVNNECYRGRAWSPQDRDDRDDHDHDHDTLESLEQCRSDGWRKKMSSLLGGCSSSTSSRDEPDLPPHLQVRLGGPVVSSRRGSAPEPSCGSAEISALAAAVRASLVGSCHGCVPARGRLADVGEASPFGGWSLRGGRRRWRGKGRRSHARDPAAKPLPPPPSEPGTFYIDGDSDAGDDNVSPSPCAPARLGPCGSPVSRPISPLQLDEEEEEQQQCSALRRGGPAPDRASPFRLDEEAREEWTALMLDVGADEGHRGYSLTRTKTPDWVPPRPATRRGPPPVTASTALGSNPFRPRTFDDPREIEGLVGKGTGKGGSRSPSPSPAAVATACFFLDVVQVGGGSCRSRSPRAETPTYNYDGNDWGNYWAGPDMQFGKRDTGFGNHVPGGLC